MNLNRRHIALALVVPAIACSFSAHAKSADEEAVDRAVSSFYQANAGVDGAALNQLLADQLSFGHSDGRVQSKGEVIESVLGRKNILKKFTLADERLSIVGDNAVVRHTVHFIAESAGKEFQGKLNVLLVWQKRGQDWVLLVRQALAFPPA